MQYTVLTAENFSPRKWSGGTTTQLFIFPLDADYQQQNFLFRLSTATVEVEKSDFSKLPGISRKIVILDGATTLFHEGHHSKFLRKFDTDAFEGAWNTNSEGQCTDFNLMMKSPVNGTLIATELMLGQRFDYIAETACDYNFVYVYRGSIQAKIGQERREITQGSLLVLEKANIFQLQAAEDSELVIVELFLML